MKTNQKVNLAILLTILTIGIAVGNHFDIVTNETILETATTLAAVLGIYYGFIKNKEAKIEKAKRLKAESEIELLKK